MVSLSAFGLILSGLCFVIMCTHLSSASALDSAGVWLGSSAARTQNAVCARNTLMFAIWRYQSGVTSTKQEGARGTGLEHLPTTKHTKHSDRIALLHSDGHHAGFVVQFESAPRGTSREVCMPGLPALYILAFRIPQRMSNFAIEHGVQVSTWTELPREVIEIVMKDLSQDDLWTCRNISSRWAAAAKTSGLLKFVTALSSYAWNEMPITLSRLHRLEICSSQVQCCLKVEPPDIAACAAMLKFLADQVMLAGRQLHLLTVNRRSGKLRLRCQRSLQSC